MKYPPLACLRPSGLSLGAALSCALLLPSLSLHAASLTWDSDGVAGGATGGTGLWNTSSTLWNNAGTMTAWNNAVSNVAIFGGTAGTVTLGTPISVSGITFSASGYSIVGSGNLLSLTGPVSVTSAGHSALIQSNITFTGATSYGGAGDITLDSGYAIDAAGFNFSKIGAGKLTMAATLTNAGTLAVSGGTMDLTGSYSQSTYGTGLTVSGGSTLNVIGTLGSSTIPLGQTAFQGDSVTNFSGTAYMSGTSSTFRIGEGTNATVNVTGGTLTIGSLSGGVVLGRSQNTAQGFLNISGGSMIITGTGTVVRIGAGYTNAEKSGASIMTISGTGLFDTGTTSTTFQLGSGLADNTASTGTLNLDGGTLATLRSIIGGTVGASFFNFNGGTLKANGPSMTLATSLTTVNVRDGGAFIDSNGFNISIAKALTHSDIGGDAAIDGGLIKLGTGILTFTGADANTFTGATWIKAGEIDLSKTTGVNAIAGNITVGDGTTAALLKLINADQIADTSVITLNGTDANAGVLRLNGKTETIGGLISTGGAGFVENESATSTTLTLNNTGTQTFSGVLRNGTLAGTLSLTKSGSGTQILSGANTYTGTTTVNEGTLKFGVDAALTSTTPIVLAAAGGTATLSLDGHTWTAGSLTFYNATSTSTSQALLDLGTGGLLTLGSSTFTVNNNNNPLGALITGGTLDLGSASRTFSIADSSSALADLTIASDITATGGAFAFTKTGAGTLKLSGTVNVGSTITVSGGVLEIAGVTVGPNPTSTTGTAIGSVGTPGVLRIVSGGDLTSSTVTVGTSAAFKGALVMTGGHLTVNPTSTQSGISLGGSGYGGFFLSGGIVDTRRVDTLDGITTDSISVMQISGGRLNTANFIMTRNERWEITLTGGEIIRVADPIALAFRSGGNAATATTTAQGSMTIAGGLVSNGTLTVTLGQQNNGSALGTATFSLNAGTFINNRFILSNNTGVTLQAFINFNGGLYRATQSTDIIITSGTGGTGTVTAYLNGAFGSFNGGLVLDSNGFNPTLSAPLLAPTGNGVTSIELTGAGSGYIGAPYVEISGGGGSGATAYATVDLDPASATYGQVTRIVVTNPGRDYTSTPTITLLGGGGSGATTGTVTTATNTSGGLTKLGTGILTLSGTTANTFTGSSQVKAGELDLAKTAGLNAIAGDLTVGDGTALAVVKLINSDQIADTSIATFNGSAATAGILRLNNKSETLGGLDSTSGAGIIENESGSAATSTLTVNVASGSHSFSGILRNGDGSGTDGTLALTKSGAGTQALGGVSTYSGATLITGGTLQISSGGTTGTGAVTVQNGATLQGSGLVKGSSLTAASGAFIRVGDGTAQGDYGSLTFTPASGSGSLDFQSGSTVVLGINPGGTSDLLNIVGTGSTTLLFNSSLTVTATPGFVPTAPEVFNLLDWTGLASAPIFASRYTFTGLLTGHDDEAPGLDLPDLLGTGYFWDLSAFTTHGTLAIVLVPEPSRLLLLALAWMLFFLRVRR